MSTTTAPIANRRNRKVLAPLATLAVAGALVVGSGADFTSQSQNSASAVTAGTLTQTNSKANQAIFDVTNIKPGDTVTGSVTITNDGSLPGAFRLTETADENTFEVDVLTMEITDGKTGAPVFTGEFGDLDTVSLGSWAAGESRTFTWVVSLSNAATNDSQGATANASYQWDAVQGDGIDVVDHADVDFSDSVKANQGLSGLAAG